MDRDRAILTEDAVLLEFLPHCQHEILHGWISPANRVRNRWPITPVRTVQPLSLSPVNPILNGRQTDTILAGDGPLGLSTPNGGHHGSTALSTSKPAGTETVLNRPSSAVAALQNAAIIETTTAPLIRPRRPGPG